jgi:hypothetical protein
LASGGWVRDKLLKKSRKNNKINIVFHTDRTDINSASLATLFKDYEKLERGDIFSHEKEDQIIHRHHSKIKDISWFRV